MIFVTVGSQHFQFNRLLNTIDDLLAAGLIESEVFAQSGYSTYCPSHFVCESFIGHERFLRAIESSEFVISHGGTGALVNALKLGKKVVAVPRHVQFGEHVDNHQVEIVERFAEMKVIEPCFDLRELGKAIKKLQEMTYNGFVSNTDRFIGDLQEYIDSASTHR